MKDTLTDANFPRTADLRVYHLGLKPGEVANRIITVGSPSRAAGLAALLDAEPKPFSLSSERGFYTYTGRFQNVPVSIISIGMGSPNMDFFVREVRECVSGDMIIIRLGSCGGLVDIPVGSIVIPKASVAINRNVDFAFDLPDTCQEPAYRISKPVLADPTLHATIQEAMEGVKPSRSNSLILTGTVNASADSFYSSQGRQTSFPDHNNGLITELTSSVPDAATLEMETFHLFHLAHCWNGRRTQDSQPSFAAAAPLTAAPVTPLIRQQPVESTQTENPQVGVVAGNTVIKAAAVQMVFASRNSRDFITPAEVLDLEGWTGKGVLIALANSKIADERLHPEIGSVWELV